MASCTSSIVMQFALTSASAAVGLSYNAATGAVKVTVDGVEKLSATTKAGRAGTVAAVGRLVAGSGTGNSEADNVRVTYL